LVELYYTILYGSSAFNTFTHTFLYGFSCLYHLDMLYSTYQEKDRRYKHMAIGERIHHFRLLRGFTQKYLGQQLGFSDSQADVRIAQYEKGARSPKEKYLNALADIFEVSPHALAVPDIDSYVGLMHTLFTLEDLYGLHIDEIDGELCLRLDKAKGTTYLSMFDMFHAWQEQAEKLKSGEITQEEYDQWRYNYPKNAK